MNGCCEECGEFECDIDHNEELDNEEIWGYDDD